MKKELTYQLCSEHILLDHQPLCNLSVFGDAQPIRTNRAVNSEYMYRFHEGN